MSTQIPTQNAKMKVWQRHPSLQNFKHMHYLHRSNISDGDSKATHLVCQALHVTRKSNLGFACLYTVWAGTLC